MKSNKRLALVVVAGLVASMNLAAETAAPGHPVVRGGPTLTKIGAAKTAAVMDREVTIDLYLENLGTEALSVVSLQDDLDAVFGAGNYTVTSAPTLIVDPGTVTLNGGFNGSSDIDILNSAGSSLAIGALARIRFVVEVTNITDQGMGVGNYANQATAAATGDPSGTAASDLSNDGTDPDPNGNQLPDDAGEDDPTPILSVVPVTLQSFEID